MTINNANQLSSNLEKPLIHNKPVITQSDAQRGYVMRHFARPVNDNSYIVEINRDEYSNLLTNPRFIVCSFKWKIVGPKESKVTSYGVNIPGVKEFNRTSVEMMDLTFKGLTKYILDYTDYWIGEA